AEAAGLLPFPRV
uniref:CAPA-Periviscerokinin-1 n=5 Tax=Mantophasmatodea TaxID=192413 RepID=PVK1_MANKU|nr:RecName: Full=CAPA-Periviscerokinin-1; Short=CAPA-PVK-1 [Mantophasma kudubergense]